MLENMNKLSTCSFGPRGVVEKTSGKQTGWNRRVAEKVFSDIPSITSKEKKPKY
jgi:hypothetical protein